MLGNLKVNRNVFVGVFLVVANLNSVVAIGQTKEELFDLMRLDKGAHLRSSVSVNMFWIKFGQDRIEELKFTKDALGSGEELEALMEPYNSLCNEYMQAIREGSPREEELDPLVRKMERDEVLAQQIFDLLGPDYCRREIIKGIGDSIAYQINEKLQSSDGFVHELENDMFAHWLNLTDEQRKQIGESKEKFGREFDEEFRRMFDEFSRLTDSHWQKLLAVLEPAQREKAITLIGAPVEWFREFQGNVTRAMLAQSAGGGLATERALEIANENNLPSDVVTARLRTTPIDKLEGMGLVVFDTLECSMLNKDVVFREIELVEKQKSELKEALKKNRSSLFCFPLPDRFQTLLAGSPRTNGIVAEILLPEQLERFKQIEMQVRLDERYDSTNGLLDPRIVEHFEISTRQKRELKGLGDGYVIDAKRLEEEAFQVRKRIHADFNKHVAKFLDESQLEFYSTVSRRIQNARGRRAIPPAFGAVFDFN